jgi:hypothetical protein
MKKEIISAFSRENLTAALTPSNPEAYYSNNETFEEMLGVELRYEKKVETWLEEEEVLGAILNKITEQKKKYKNSSIY